MNKTNINASRRTSFKAGARIEIRIPLRKKKKTSPCRIEANRKPVAPSASCPPAACKSENRSSPPARNEIVMIGFVRFCCPRDVPWQSPGSYTDIISLTESPPADVFPPSDPGVRRAAKSRINVKQTAPNQCNVVEIEPRRGTSSRKLGWPSGPEKKRKRMLGPLP